MLSIYEITFLKCLEEIVSTHVVDNPKPGTGPVLVFNVVLAAMI